MNEETQKFLALEGLRSWANAVVLQVERMQSSRDALLELRGLDSQWIKRMGQFRSDRHLFLVSAWKLIEHMDWADKLGCLENNNFSEIQEMKRHKGVARYEQHVLEGFLGDGRRQHAWMQR